jgi:uncharacterized membrane protein
MEEINSMDANDPVENSGPENNDNKPASGSFIRIVSLILTPIIAAIVLFVVVVYFVPYSADKFSFSNTKVINSSEIKKDAAYKKQISLMNKDIQRLSKKYGSFSSGSSYIVINTTENRFYLYKNKTLLREGICSSGANKILKSAKKTFVFKTPKGKFSITGKRKNPYWHRSDWDFIEQGLPIPPKDDPSRWEAGTLGDYALDMVDGYMIHGTIYKRLMGMPVTHGCVRLGDEDLEVVFNTLNIGSKVYIF